MSGDFQLASIECGERHRFADITGALPRAKYLRKGNPATTMSP
jgi:hypothetical protein